MPLLKSDEIEFTKWYNNNYTDCFIAVLKFAKANNAVLYEKEHNIHMQIGFKDIYVSFIDDDKVGIDISIKTFLFKAKRFMKKFYLEIGQFLEEVK